MSTPGERFLYAADHSNGHSTHQTPKENEVLKKGDLMVDFMLPHFFGPYESALPGEIDTHNLAEIYALVYWNSAIKYAAKNQLIVRNIGSIGRGVAEGSMPPGHFDLSKDVQTRLLPELDPESPEYQTVSFYTYDRAADADLWLFRTERENPDLLRRFNMSLPNLLEKVANPIEPILESEADDPAFKYHETKYFQMKRSPSYIVCAEYGELKTNNVSVMKLSIYKLGFWKLFDPLLPLPPDIKIMTLNNITGVYQRLMRIDCSVDSGTVAGAKADKRYGNTNDLQDNGFITVTGAGDDENPIILYTLEQSTKDAMEKRDRLHLLRKSPNEAIELFLRSIVQNAQRNMPSVEPDYLPYWWTQTSFFEEIRTRMQEFVFFGYNGKPISVTPAVAQYALYELFLCHQLSLETIQILYDSGFFDAYYKHLPLHRNIWEKVFRSDYFTDTKFGRIVTSNKAIWEKRENYRLHEKYVDPDGNEADLQFHGLFMAMQALKDAKVIEPDENFLREFVYFYRDLPLPNAHDQNLKVEFEKPSEQRKHFLQVLNENSISVSLIIDNLIDQYTNQRDVVNIKVIDYLRVPNQRKAVEAVFTLLYLFKSGMTAYEIEQWYKKIPYSHFENAKKPTFPTLLTILKLFGVLRRDTRYSVDDEGYTRERVYYSLRDTIETNNLYLLQQFDIFRSALISEFHLAFPHEEIVPGSETKLVDNILSDLILEGGIDTVETVLSLKAEENKPEYDYKDIQKFMGLNDETASRIRNLGMIVRNALIRMDLHQSI